MGNQTANTTDPQLLTVLDQIGKFGFRFFGYGENNEPLVIAPNGQVIPIKIAYEFVQQQINKSQIASSGGSLENMPEMPVSVDSGSFETKVETNNPEKESNIETSQQQKKQTSLSTVQNKSNDEQNPKISTGKMNPPFDDGFKIRSFDPTDIAQATKFVEDNQNGSASSTKTWLAAQFKKFMLEYNLKSSK